MFNILFVGDIVGSPGRDMVGNTLHRLCSELSVDMVIANGENAAGGFGITPPTADALFDRGIDVITLGNHSFSKRDAWDELEHESRILRPANYPPQVRGKGWDIYHGESGEPVAVINLMGRTFMTPVDCPFRAADAILDRIGESARIILVDMHAEATSEKIALGWRLDGRVSAVVGTHTHVATADERILPRGTAYITDVGMTGVRNSVLGMDCDVVINRFMTQVQGRLTLAEGPAILSAVLIEIDPKTGLAQRIRRVSREEQ